MARTVTNVGSFKNVKEHKKTGKVMTRLAVGRRPAAAAYEALLAAGAVENASTHTQGYTKHCSGVTANGKLFVYENAASIAAVLYVEE